MNRLYKYLNATLDLYKLTREPENNPVPPEGCSLISKINLPRRARSQNDSARGTCNPMKYFVFSKPCQKKKIFYFANESCESYSQDIQVKFSQIPHLF